MSCSIPPGSPAPMPSQDGRLQPPTHVGKDTDIYPRRHMRPTTHLICRHRPAVGCCQIPIETVRSHSVAYAVVPCRAGAPAAKQRNGSTSREHITQKRDEHAPERAWNGNVPLKLTRLTKGRKTWNITLGVWTGGGQGLGRRHAQSRLGVPSATPESRPPHPS